MDSSKVFVFPCVSRSDNYSLKSKLMSEENITNIIKSITDKKSYIINDDLKNLEFVINGYYFKLNNYELSGNQYAYIITDTNDNGALLKGDSATEFDGLIITTERPDNGEYLILCENNIIPENSKVKFQSKSLRITNIDCGELN